MISWAATGVRRFSGAASRSVRDQAVGTILSVVVCINTVHGTAATIAEYAPSRRTAQLDYVRLRGDAKASTHRPSLPRRVVDTWDAQASRSVTGGRSSTS